MRLRSQEHSASSTSSSPAVSSGQTIATSDSTIQKSASQAGRSFSKKRYRVLRIFLFIAALSATGLELKQYMPLLRQWYSRQGYFIYTGIAPSAGIYSPNGRYLVVCLPITRKISEIGAEVVGGRVELYDGRTGKHLSSVYKGNIHFDKISFSRSQNRLYLIDSARNSVYSYDIASKNLRQMPQWSTPVYSALNPSENSVIRIYKDRISIQNLDTRKSYQVDLPHVDNLNSVTSVAYSKDQRFISWISYSINPDKKMLRLVDTREKRVFDVEEGSTSTISSASWAQHPIVLSSRGTSVYMSGYVYKPAGDSDLREGIAEVDLASGKVLRSRSEMPGVGVSHVSGDTVYLKNALQDTAQVLDWERPAMLSGQTNVLTTSPDKRWGLIYDLHGIKRYAIRK